MQGDELSRFYLSARSRLEIIGSKELDLVQVMADALRPVLVSRLPGPAYRANSDEEGAPHPILSACLPLG